MGNGASWKSSTNNGPSTASRTTPLGNPDDGDDENGGGQIGNNCPKSTTPANNISRSAGIDRPDFPGQVLSKSGSDDTEEHESHARGSKHRSGRPADDNDTERSRNNVIGGPSGSNKVDPAVSWMKDSKELLTTNNNRISAKASKDRSTVSTREGLCTADSALADSHGKSKSASSDKNVYSKTEFERRRTVIPSAAKSKEKELRKMLSWGAPSSSQSSGKKSYSTTAADSSTNPDFETHWSDDGDILAIVVPTSWSATPNGHRRRGSASSLDEDIREIERTVSVDSGLEGATRDKSVHQPEGRPALSGRSASESSNNGSVSPRRIPSSSKEENGLGGGLRVLNFHHGPRNSPLQIKNSPNRVQILGLTISSVLNNRDNEGNEMLDVTKRTSGELAKADATTFSSVATSVRSVQRVGSKMQRSILRAQSGPKSMDRLIKRVESSSNFALGDAGFASSENSSEWKYNQPKIDGFDPVKFKEANSRSNHSNVSARHITLPL